MGRGTQDRGLGPEFRDPARIKHADPVGDAVHHAEVVGDEEHTEPAPAADFV